ncbi:MAG: patatin-like phospholipase family protein [Nitrospiraceae bacterium]
MSLSHHGTPPTTSSVKKAEGDLTHDPPLSLLTVLQDEFIAIHGQQVNYPLTPTIPDESSDDKLRALHHAIHGLTTKRSALCLSGGGIRSASFSLGVLQALSNLHLLDKFDYLSTVSGGGYIGSWLTAWVHRTRSTAPPNASSTNTDHTVAPGPADSFGISEVQDALKTNGARSAVSVDSPEPHPIRWLRDYSNYLTPTLGFFSADSWTMVGTALRNLLVNWSVLIPLLVAACMVPRLHIALISYEQWYPFVWIALTLGLAGACMSLAYLHYHRPGLARLRCPENDPARRQKAMRFSTQGWFLVLGLLPLVLGLYGLTTAWAWHRNGPGSLSALQLWGLTTTRTFAICAAGTHLLAWFLAVGLSLWHAMTSRQSPPPLKMLGLFGWYTGAVAASGSLGGYLLWAILSTIPSEARCSDIGSTACLTVGHYAEWYAAFAVPGMLGLFLLLATLFLAIAARFTDDQDNEYWARAGSWMLNAGFVSALLASLIIFGPGLVATLGVWTSASVGGLAGVLSLIGGFSAKTMLLDSDKKDRTSSWMDLGVRAATPLFVALLIVGLAWSTSHVLRGWSLAFWGNDPAGQELSIGEAMPEPNVRAHITHSLVLHHATFPAAVTLCVTLALVGMGMSYFVNINKFSLHGFYRNRLIRAYLGASRELGPNRRIPHPFTGFDGKDNIYMAELAGYDVKNRVPTSRPLQRPFHVINIALNLVRTNKLAWQQRKAQSFTASPLHCGSCRFQQVETAPESGQDTTDPAPTGAYRRSQDYGFNSSVGRPISLGTAMATSGAAASPNMGYHSSAAVTFLMAFFNIRLGWWLGNPSRAGDQPPLGQLGKFLGLPSMRSYRRSHPQLSFLPLFKELFGFTDASQPYVYLSDGGHFENLGLYEMVLRRCHTIVVVDAGCDDNTRFEDLGNAVRKIRIDLGIEIEINTDELRPTQGTRHSKWHHAIGTIRYDTVDDGAPVGTLVYLKPSLNGTEPSDVREYADHHETFPHEATSDQFFDEPQFEAYRRLGEHIGTDVFTPGVGDTSQIVLDDVIRKLESAWLQTEPSDEDHAALSASLSSFQQQLGQSAELEALDRAIYPELGSVLNAPTTEIPPMNLRSALHTCASQLQLMQRAYRQLHLETTASLQHNSGWISLFHRWTATAQFQESWPFLASTVSVPFREWAEREFNLAAAQKSFTIVPAALTPTDMKDLASRGKTETGSSVFATALAAAWPIFPDPDTEDSTLPFLVAQCAGNALRRGEPIGVGFFRQTESPTVEMWTWSHPAYRSLGVQEAICEDMLNRLPEVLAQLNRPTTTITVDLGALNMLVSPRKHPHASLIRLYERFGFLRGKTGTCNGRLIYERTYVLNAGVP